MKKSYSLVFRRWAITLLCILNLFTFQNSIYAQSCSCTDYLIVNDEAGQVHKFEIDSNTGSLAEIPAIDGTLPFLVRGY